MYFLSKEINYCLLFIKNSIIQKDGVLSLNLLLPPSFLLFFSNNSNVVSVFRSIIVKKLQKKLEKLVLKFI